MGRSQQNASVQFASWVPAERRWAMTGTPTKHGATALSQIHALMSFLQHEFFTSKLEGTDHWRRCIVKSWKDGHVAAFARYGTLRDRRLQMDRRALTTKCMASYLVSPQIKVATSNIDEEAYKTGHR